MHGKLQTQMDTSRSPDLGLKRTRRTYGPFELAFSHSSNSTIHTMVFISDRCCIKQWSILMWHTRYMIYYFKFSLHLLTITIHTRLNTLFVTMQQTTTWWWWNLHALSHLKLGSRFMMPNIVYGGIEFKFVFPCTLIQWSFIVVWPTLLTSQSKPSLPPAVHQSIMIRHLLMPT